MDLFKKGREGDGTEIDKDQTDVETEEDQAMYAAGLLGARSRDRERDGIRHGSCTE